MNSRKEMGEVTVYRRASRSAVEDRVHDEVSLARRPYLRARPFCEVLGDGISF